MPKITIVGAGAYIFPLTEIRDILSFPALRDSTICMYDINAERNNLNAVGARKLIESYSLPTKLQVTTDRKEAVKDTDFFICTFQVGGIEAYGYDVNIPRKYGIDQCVGDTFGPGGVFRGLRSLEALRVLAEDIRAMCPDALLIQYANPMAINSTGTTRFGVNNIGLCHSVQGTSRLLAREMDLPYEECSFIVAGLNHQAWFVDFRHKGKDVMPLLRKTMMEKHLSGKDKGEESDDLYAGGSERVRTEIMRLTGYFHTEGSQHASEYMPYFRKNPEMVLEYQPNRWDFYEICSKHDEENRVARFIENIGQRELTPSHEYGAWIIDSITTGTLRLVHGSVPNEGSITNLPQNVAVEVPVFVDRQGLRPQVVGDIPPACAAVSMTTVNQVQLAVEASLTGDRDLIYAAVAMDPLTGALLTLPQIRKMVDEMLEAEKQWLPAFESRTFITAGKEDLPFL